MTKQKNIEVVVIAGLGFFFSIFPSIMNALKSNNVIELLCFILVLSGGFYFIWLLIFKTKVIKPPRTIFGGVRRYKPQDITWERNHQTTRIVNKMFGTKSKICLITGASGSGKSVLIETQVIPGLEQSNNELQKRVISSYENIIVTLDRLTKEIKNIGNKKFLLVFDQFEQLTTRTKDEQKAVVEFIRLLQGPPSQLPCIVVVRPDYYYQLKFLEELLPNPTDAIEIPGLDVNQGSEEYIRVVKDLEIVATKECISKIFSDLKDDLSSQAEGQILPLELQMVGQMLHVQKQNQRHNPIELDDYPGKAQLIKKYFQTYIQSSPHPDCAISVLYALTAKTVLRRSLNLKEICAASFYPQDVIEETINYFEGEGLIWKTQTDHFEWTHDQLAFLFREFSTTEIDSTLRDNVTYLVERKSKNIGYRSKIFDSDDSKALFRKRMAIGLLFFMMIGSWIRMLRPELFGNPFNDPSFKIMGPLYLGFGWAQLAWAIYVVKVSIGFFARLKLKAAIITFWTLFILGGLVVVGCWFYPRSWLLGISFIGFLMGLCFWWIGRNNSHKWHSNNSFRDHIRGIITPTLITSVVGSLYVLITSKYIIDNAYFIEVVSLVFVAVNIIFAAYTIKCDAVSEFFEKYLGLIERT